MHRALVATTVSTLLVLGFSAPRVAAQPSWDVSVYAGQSMYPGNGAGKALATRVSLTRGERTSVYRLGAEAGYLGLGSRSRAFLYEPLSGAGDGTTHYDSFHVGPIFRVQTTGSQRLKAYAVLGLAPYALKFEAPKRDLYVGGTLGAGFYGIAPGMFGVEARWHLIPSGDPYSPSPLSLGSIMAGVNF